MPTKEQLVKTVLDLEYQNRGLFSVFVDIQTTTSWNEKKIREVIRVAIKSFLEVQEESAEKPKRIRKQKELEPA